MGEYGNIEVTHRSPVVVEAPDRALISLEMIAHPGSQLDVRGGRIYVGHTAGGRPVCYRVVGWEPAGGSLIVEREAP